MAQANELRVAQCPNLYDTFVWMSLVRTRTVHKTSGSLVGYKNVSIYDSFGTDLIPYHIDT